jgi:phosphatidylethanolamine/phosphatidyl-N-methylethanolamine N-methyltransferase
MIDAMNKSSEKFYDRLSLLYPLIDLFLRPQKRKFFSTINGYPHGRLLEIGVGNGSHLKYYAHHEITGIDTSKSMLASARKHQKDNTQLLQMNGEALRFPNEAFDYVILSHVIAVVEDPEKVMDEVYRVLKPNGRVFILNHFTPEHWLRYLDIAFEKISRLLHFKSVFHITSVQKIKKFTLLSEFNAGLFSYFKILIYEKNV